MREGTLRNKYLGVFLVLVTIPLIFLSILVLSSNKLATGKYYKALFQKSDSYELVIKALPKTEGAVSNGNIFTLISTNATPAWVEKTINQNLDQIEAYINQQTPTLDPSIDISSFKDKVTAELPTEIQEIVPNIISFSTYAEYLANAKQLLSEASNTTSGVNQTNITDIDQQTNNTKQTQQQFTQNTGLVKTGLHYGQIISYIIFALTLLMLLMIILATRHSISAIFHWTGWTLLVGGLSSFGLAFLIKYVTKNYDLLAQFHLSTETKQLLIPIYNNISTDIASTITKISFLVAVIGLIAIITSYILPKFISPKGEPTPLPAKI